MDETILPVLKAPRFMTYAPAQLLFEAVCSMREQFDRLQLERFGADRTTLDAAFLQVTEAIADRERLAAAVASARGEANDDLEIDDDPVTSESDVGVWVSAWIYVPNEEEG